MRAGVHDPHLLMWLQEALEEGRLQGQVADRAPEALDEAPAIAENQTPLTDAGMAEPSHRLRDIYTAASR